MLHRRVFWVLYWLLKLITTVHSGGSIHAMSWRSHVSLTGIVSLALQNRTGMFCGPWLVGSQNDATTIVGLVHFCDEGWYFWGKRTFLSLHCPICNLRCEARNGDGRQCAQLDCFTSKQIINPSQDDNLWILTFQFGQRVPPLSFVCLHSTKAGAYLNNPNGIQNASHILSCCRESTNLYLERTV